MYVPAYINSEQHELFFCWYYFYFGMIFFPLAVTRWRKTQLSSEKSALFPYIIPIITTCCSIASCTSTQKLGYKLYQEARTHPELLVPKGENVQFKSRPTWFHHKSLGTQTKCEGIRKTEQAKSYVHIGKHIGRGLQTKEGNACAFLGMLVKSFYLQSAWHKSTCKGRRQTMTNELTQKLINQYLFLAVTEYQCFIPYLFSSLYKLVYFINLYLCSITIVIANCKDVFV